MSQKVSADSPVAVIKIGGSILKGLKAFRRAARFVRNLQRTAPHERLVIVVSAQEGFTDRLAAAASRIVAQPDSAALDVLWSTGELRSVALLALQLQALGISAAALNIHEAGLTLPDSEWNPDSIGRRVHINPRRIRSVLSHRAVAIVPGFFATDPAGAVVSLGRGGSDLTAVLLAQALDACRCELVKDVPGYFTSDPHRDPAARHLPELSFERALAMADDGCELVQRNAIQAAAVSHLQLLIRSLDENAPVSRIVPATEDWAWKDSTLAAAAS